MKTIKVFIVLFLCICIASLTAQTSEKPPKKAQQQDANRADKTNKVDQPQPQSIETSVEKPEEFTGMEDDIKTDDFVYRPEDRRDPFWNPTQGKGRNLTREEREGIAGMLIDELELEGIIFKEGKYIALFKGPDGKPYDIKVGDNVYDGEVIRIDLKSVVFKRILTVALGGTKEKIIIKPLTPEEEGAKQ